MINIYDIVDTTTGKVVASASTKFNAEEKLSSLNDKENGHKYAAKINPERIRAALPKVFCEK